MLALNDIPGIQFKTGVEGCQPLGLDDYIGIIELKPVGELKPLPITISDIGFGAPGYANPLPLSNGSRGAILVNLRCSN